MKIRRRPPSQSVNVIDLCYQVAVPDAEPQNILEEIVWHKEKEIEQRRERITLLELKKRVQAAPPPQDFLAALDNSQLKPALIAEVKKASPSKGVIRADFEPVSIAQAYQQAGASCISVLTDQKYFQGSFENLALIRQAVKLPLLCKEFVIYPYQIYLARSQGADAILLIAAILSDQDLQYFVKITKAIGMTPLIEVHTLTELERVLSLEGVTLVGINNRNLENFSVDLQTTCQLLQSQGHTLQQRGIRVVSESGLHQAEDIKRVKNVGAQAVLIGESLLRQPDPVNSIKKLFH